MSLRLSCTIATVAIAFSTLHSVDVMVSHDSRDKHFTISTACAVCHIAAPGATAMTSNDGEDVSPYYTWQATMMANSFREIIDFSKNIPGFKKLDLNDQIALIKGSCVEMLFIKVSEELT